MLVDRRPSRHEVVQQEVVRLGEPARRWRSGKISRSWRSTSHGSGCSSSVGAPELHPVLLAEALDLAVAQHRQPGQRRHERRDAEVLVALAELLDRGLLVRVAHEVDVALEDLGVELEGLLDDRR